MATTNNAIKQTVNIAFEQVHKKTMTPDIAIGGVINSNGPEWLYEDLYNAINISYDEWVKECNPSEEDKECYEEDNDTYIVGFVLNSEDEYEPDTEAEYSAIISSPYTQIIKSKWVSKCAMCSMCYPGQGDLDTEGEQVTYTLPPEVWGDTEHLNIEKVN